MTRRPGYGWWRIWSAPFVCLRNCCLPCTANSAWSMFRRILSRSFANLCLQCKRHSVAAETYARCWSYLTSLKQRIMKTCRRNGMIVNLSLLIIIRDVPDVEVLTCTTIHGVVKRLTRGLLVRVRRWRVPSKMTCNVGENTKRGRQADDVWRLRILSPLLWTPGQEVQHVGCEVQSRRRGDESNRSSYVVFSRTSDFGWHCGGSPHPLGCGSDMVGWKSDDIVVDAPVCSWANDVLWKTMLLF